MKKRILTVLSMLVLSFALVAFTACGGKKEKGDGNDGGDSGFKLTLTTNIEAAGTVTGGGHFDYNKDLCINAETNSGYYFLGWYYNNDLIATSAKYNCKMWDKDVTLEAKFTALPKDYDPSNGGMSVDQLLNQKYELEIKAGMPNYGKIAVNDGDDTNKYTSTEKAGTNIKVRALTTSSQRLLGWFDEAGNLVMANAVFNFSMPGFDYSLTAKWECITPDLQFDSGSDTFICTHCGGDHDYSSDFEIKTIKGSKVLVKYNGYSTDVVIPDVIEVIGNSAFYNYDGLTSVTIGDSVKTIEEKAFADCSNLSKINLGKNLNLIDKSAFNYCANLTSIVVDEQNEFYHSSGNCLIQTSSKTLMLGCKNSIIPSDNSVEIIGDFAFYGTSITSITIPNGVTSIGKAAFKNCTSLTSIIIPDSVKSIGEAAFNNCTSLTSIIIPDSVKSIGDSAFYYCTSLTSVTIGNSVTSIGDEAFYSCGSLTSVTIPDSVKSIGDSAFKSCYKLANVTIGEGVTSIGASAFRDCMSLTIVIIPDNVQTIKSCAFHGCNNLIIFCEVESKPSAWESEYSSTSWNSSSRPVYWGFTGENGVTNAGLIWTSKDSKIVICGYVGTSSNVIIPDKIENIPVVGINDSAFKNNKIISSVTIGNNVATIGANAFCECENLKTVIIGKGVTSIESFALAWCSSLTSIKYRGTQSQWGAISKQTWWIANTDSYTITYDYTDNNTEENTGDSSSTGNYSITDFTPSEKEVLIDVIGCTIPFMPTNAYNFQYHAEEGVICIMMSDNTKSDIEAYFDLLSEWIDIGDYEEDGIVFHIFNKGEVYIEVVYYPAENENNQEGYVVTIMVYTEA